jgi:hypothetical protein
MSVYVVLVLVYVRVLHFKLLILLTNFVKHGVKIVSLEDSRTPYVLFSCCQKRVTDVENFQKLERF